MSAPGPARARRCAAGEQTMIKAPPLTTEYSHPRQALEQAILACDCRPRPRGRGRGAPLIINGAIAWRRVCAPITEYYSASRPLTPSAAHRPHPREYSQPRCLSGGRRSSTTDCVLSAAGPTGLEAAAGPPIALEPVDHRRAIAGWRPRGARQWSRIDHQSCDCAAGPAGAGCWSQAAGPGDYRVGEADGIPDGIPRRDP